MQLAAPVGQLAFDRLALVAFALPDCEVAVLQRERRQVRNLAGGADGINRGQFIQHHAQRPTVDHDVVER